MIIKRLFDLVVGLALLVLAAVPMAFVAVAVRLGLGSPVLFPSQRPGMEGRVFTMYKFRTMTDERDQNGVLLPDAERLTRLGRFLRSTSIDEMPALLNVVKGEMSLVGPRPLLPEYIERYTKEQSRRHDVRPGLTGLAQVRGRNEISWEERFRLDVWYVDNRSLWLDLWILAETLGVVLTRKGVSAPGHATMPEFRGTEDC